MRFKQLIIGVLIGLITFGSISSLSKSENLSIPITYENIKITIDGKESTSNVEPFIYNGSTFVPVRFVSEALGAKVDWIKSTNTVEIVNTIRNENLNLLSQIEVLKNNLDTAEIKLDEAKDDIDYYKNKYDSLLESSTQTYTPPKSIETTDSLEDDKEVIVYITKTGEKYHSSGCRYLSRSKISISLNNAKSQGYGACSVCNPPR